MSNSSLRGRPARTFYSRPTNREGQNIKVQQSAPQSQPQVAKAKTQTQDKSAQVQIPVVPVEDPKVQKLGTDVDQRLQVQVKDEPKEKVWSDNYDPVRGYDGRIKYFDLKPQPEFQTESSDKDNQPKAAQNGGGGAAGRNGNQGQGSAQTWHKEKDKNKFSKPKAPVAPDFGKGTRTLKKARNRNANPATLQPREPERFVFSSDNVNLESLEDRYNGGYRSASLSRVDPTYKSFLLSLNASCETNRGDEEEQWDD